MTKQDEKDLTVVYMAGYHKRDDEVRALQKEIERLKDELSKKGKPCNGTKKAI